MLSLFWGLSGEPVAAEERIDKLVMPGELIQGHAKYENQCEKCHQEFSKEVQTKLCADCHEEAAQDIKDGTGYHGLDPVVKDKPCKECHTDHIGRQGNIVIFSPQHFDHEKTDFPLEGAHRSVVCSSCHSDDKEFREAPSPCFDCHKDDDVHKGELGEKCADCHDQRLWSKTEFDHDETDFPLRAKHKEVACEGCHADERYENTPEDCFACHQLNDVHGGRYGKKCEDCHSESDWKKTDFDHDKQTDYPLVGKHKRVSCDACHKNDLYADLATACIGCHRSDDVHRGRYGEKCESCHSEREWKKTDFDHDRDTDYKLLGKHADVACEDCHKGNAEDETLETECIACHRKDDVHRGVEGKQCESCHREGGWSIDVMFNHDMSAFPLLGLHAMVPCEDCHFDQVYKATQSACVDCHRKDDEHKGKLGVNCASCHNPNSWAIWVFDHDAQTEYVLDGKHKELACLACHTREVKSQQDLILPATCIECHQADDVHNGQFGRDCARCHTTEDFRKIQGRRSRTSTPSQD